MANSKLTKCKHCGAEIAKSAKVCPHCGGKNQNGSFVTLVIGLLLVIYGCNMFLNGLNNTFGGTSSSKSKSSTSSVSTTAINEDAYKEACEEVDYKELCRYPEKYEGKRVKVKVKVYQILSESKADNGEAWRAYSDSDELGLYYSDEYYLLDMRSADSVKILDDDIIVVYGGFSGLKNITRALTNTTDEIPEIEVRFAELVETE